MRKLGGTDALGEGSAGDLPITEPVPRRLVSANFENASRIRAFWLRSYFFTRRLWPTSAPVLCAPENAFWNSYRSR